MDKYIGRLLDNRYEIMEVIGTGGMAVVYKARCHRLNRLVAIKILKDDYSQDGEFRRRFHAESQAVAMLNHPNIVSVYDVSTQGDADYIVMELVEGITLKQYMERRGGHLNWKESLHFAMQIGRALEHAHNQGIVHRDIKPHNVMILKNGSAKVTDFGIARVMSAQNTLTREALGSVHYISPEQAKGGRVDNRSDIYSLGVVMYEMICGRPPYDGESPVSVALQHINGGAAMPSTLNPNIPGGLEQIIMRAMSVDPDQRYTSATAMLYDLEEFRQNPNILFTYGMEQPVVESPAPVQRQAPRTAAERAEAAPRPRTEQPRPAQRPGGNYAPNPGRPTAQRPMGQPGTQRPAGQSGTPRPAGQTGTQRPAGQGTAPRQQNTQARQSYQQREAERRRNKNLIIAIVSCGGALLLALIVLIVVLFGGNGNDEPLMLQVPDFIGEIYEELDAREYPGLILVDDKYEFNEEHPAGEIIDQTPAKDTQVKTGTEVKLVISSGPMTDEMLDLVGKSKDNAKDLLNELKDLSLVIMFDDEYNAEIEAGNVCRTEPAAGATLTKGQTVTLWISAGPRTAVMPDLTDKTKADAQVMLDGLKDMKLNVRFQEETSEEIEEGKVTRTEPAEGETIAEGAEITVFISSGSGIVKTTVPGVVGMDISKAISILKDYNLKFEYDVVESDKPKDQVLTQDIDKGTEVPEGTTIYMTISAGPKETEPTEPQPTEKRVTFLLPGGITVAYRIEVCINGVPEMDPYTVEPGQTSIENVSLTGVGVVRYDIYVNGAKVDEFEIDFNSPDVPPIQLEFTVE